MGLAGGMVALAEDGSRRKRARLSRTYVLSQAFEFIRILCPYFHLIVLAKLELLGLTHLFSQSTRAQRLSGRALAGYIPDSAGSMLEAEPLLPGTTDSVDELDDEGSTSQSRSASCQPDSAGAVGTLNGLSPTNGNREKRRVEKDVINHSSIKEESASQHPPETSKGLAVSYRCAYVRSWLTSD